MLAGGVNVVEGLTLPEALIKTIDHFVPEFWAALSKVTDPRHPLLSVYPLQQELFVGVLLFMVKLGARRNIKYKLGSPAFVASLKCVMERYYPDAVFPESMFHGDTLNYVLKQVSPAEIHGLRALVIRSLLRKRCLEAFRLKGLYYPVAVDGTGALVFSQQALRPLSDEDLQRPDQLLSSRRRGQAGSGERHGPFGWDGVRRQ